MYTKPKFKKGSRQEEVCNKVELDFAKELLKMNSIRPMGDWVIIDDIIPNKEQEEENSMNNEKNYLNDLLEATYWNKRRELEKKYNLDVNPDPQNFRELLDWVETKKYTINEKRAATIDARIAEGAPYFNIFDGLQWNGRPTPDRDGYAKAIDQLNDQKVKTRSRIVVLGGEAALAQVEALEAWTPVGNA